MKKRITGKYLPRATREILVGTILLPAFLLGLGSAVSAQESKLEAQELQILASKIQQGGYRCANVHEAREMKADRVGQVQWIVQCDTGTFKLTLHGDTGATVVKVE